MKVSINGQPTLGVFKDSVYITIENGSPRVQMDVAITTELLQQILAEQPLAEVSYHF